MNKIISLLLVIALYGCGRTPMDYKTIHDEAIVVDLHSDTAMRMADGFDFAIRDTTGDMDLPRLKEGGVDLQVLACYVSSNRPIDSCRERVDLMLDSIEANVSRNSDKINICTTAKQAESIIADGKIAIFLGIENGAALENDISNLDHYYQRGVRYLTLVHTSTSDWCVSSSDTAPAFNGLTDFGRDVVRKMDELGMIIDVSHAHPLAVAEVLKLTRNPVIASHSCVYALCDHDRNLTDEQIKAIAANGGVIGINFFNAYISQIYKDSMDSIFAGASHKMDSLSLLYDDNPDTIEFIRHEIFGSARKDLMKIPVTIDDVIDHIDYIVKLVGPDYVGLGSDFDGVFALPEGIDDCSKVPNITKALVERGYSRKDIKKILGGNFMRVFRTVCGT